MKGYRQFIKELPHKKVVFAFGRFNPPTIGHEKLIQSVQHLAHGADHVIYASHSQDSKKNPLEVGRKVYYLKRMFPRVNFKAAGGTTRTFLEVAKELNKKYKDIIMVAGSDRVAEFKKLLDTYNGKDFNFDSIQVISAGVRDADADDASGASGTKMRGYASKNDFKSFKRYLPHTLTDLDARRLMNEVRVGMGLEPVRESIKYDIDDVREQYFQGNLFNVGDTVESDGNLYQIEKCGSNHLLCIGEDGQLVSKWLHDVVISEREFSRVPKDKDSGLAKKYVSGLSKSTAKARAAHWKKADKLSDKDPEAYKPAPGDARAKTKPSKHTKKYKELFGEELKEMSDQLIFTHADKIKVARIIATTLGVDEAQKKSNPKELVNMGLRKIRSKPMTKNGYEILMNMLDTARMAGIDYDKKLVPQRAAAIREETEMCPCCDCVAEECTCAPDCKGCDCHDVEELAAFHGTRSQKTVTIKKKKVDTGMTIAQKIAARRKSGDFTNRGEEVEQIEENKAVRKKADKSGVSYATLMKVYKRGVAAWNSGHRPGTTPEQWGLARVNSYITKGKGTYHGADKDLRENVEVDTSRNDNMARAIMRYSDMMRMVGKKPFEKAEAAYQDDNYNHFPDPVGHKKDSESDLDAVMDPKKTSDNETGSKLVQPAGDDNLRRRKVNYHLGEDTEIWMDILGEEGIRDYEQDIQITDFTEDELEIIANNIADELDEDDIIDEYDNDDFAIVDDETGEEDEEETEEILKKDDGVNEEAINEVLSRMARIRAKQRLKRTSAKRNRARKIALRKFSTTKTVNSRAKRLAVKAMKKRFTRGRDLNKLSVAEKERLEQRITKLRPLINRIALKMVPRVRKLEKERLSHRSFTKK